MAEESFHMKKGVLLGVLFILLISLSFVSANWFSDFLGKFSGNTNAITGQITYGGNHHCNSVFANTYELDIGQTPCSSYSSVAAGCIAVSGIGYYNVVGCVDNSGKNFLCYTSACTLPPPPCTDSSWTPSAADTCSNQTVKQTSNCGRTRVVNGTKNCSVVVPVTCTDSDGGLNYTVKGTTSGYYSWEGKFGSNSDMCGTLYSNGYFDDAETGNAVGELYCLDSTNVNYTYYLCSNGCSNGACLLEPAIVYTSSCDNSSCIIYEGQNVDPVHYSTTLGYVSSDTAIFTIEGEKTNALYVGNSYMLGNFEIRITAISFSTKDSVPSKVAFTYRLIPSTCTDSDGGLNYEVKGTISGVYDGYNYSTPDMCGSKYYQRNFVFENFCNDTFGGLVSYECPNGCFEGACLSDTSQVCPYLIDSIKNPVSTEERRVSYNESYRGSATVNDVPEGYTNYATYIYWNSPNKEQDQIDYYGVQYDLRVFDNKGINLSEYATWHNNDFACKATSYWANNKENVYYICNWNVFNNQQDLANDYQDNNRQIFWYNDNVLVEMYLYWGNELTDAQVQQLSQQRINELLNNLQNNNYKYVDWSNFEVSYPASDEVGQSLSDCSSDLVFDNSVSQRSWECKTEPIICPEHGYQTKICKAYNSQTGKYDTQENRIECSPGICSGCYVPKWFDSNPGQNKCIPYGFRFEQQTGWSLEEVFVNNSDSEKLSVREALNYGNDLNLTVYENNTALLSLEVSQGVWADIYLEQGKDYDWKALTGGMGGDNLNYTLHVDSIFYSYSDYIESGISVSFIITGYMNQQLPQTINAYCDIDGYVNMQKTKSGGEWAKCQNNYECESNLCSSGECIDLQAITKQAAGFAGVWAKFTCKFADFFGIDTYESCITEKFGTLVQ